MATHNFHSFFGNCIVVTFNFQTIDTTPIHDKISIANYDSLFVVVFQNSRINFVPQMHKTGFVGHNYYNLAIVICISFLPNNVYIVGEE